MGLYSQLARVLIEPDSEINTKMSVSCKSYRTTIYLPIRCLPLNSSISMSPTDTEIICGHENLAIQDPPPPHHSITQFLSDNEPSNFFSDGNIRRDKVPRVSLHIFHLSSRFSRTMIHLGALQYDRAPRVCYWLSAGCIPDFQGLEFRSLQSPQMGQRILGGCVSRSSFIVVNDGSPSLHYRLLFPAVMGFWISSP